MIVYTPLWETLKKKGISTYKLEKTYNMNKNMIHNLKHNKSITMNTLDYLCKTFDCGILDVIEYIKDE